MARRRRIKNVVEDRMAKLMDQLARFEEFQNMPQEIREDLKRGMTEKDLREKYASYIQAMMISTALTDQDSSKRIQAGKDVMDRKEGKAKETKEIEHRLSKLNDTQLDALLRSELDSLPLGSEEEEEQSS